jgi:hypothetical protein
MENIIKPIALDKILSELTPARFVRNTNNSDNELYIVNYHNSPYTTKEVGRLREVTFRDAGGGTGKSCDLDVFDTREDAFYEQLIVWAPQAKEIVGGYRFILCDKILKSQKFNDLAMSKLFNFSDNFINNYLPYTIELGRSFVQPNFQPSANSRRGIFSLDNLWDGLGALIVDNPSIKYLFGKITMYLDYNKNARDYVLAFMKHFFCDEDTLLYPYTALEYHHDVNYFIKEIKDLSYKEAFRVLQNKVRELDENIPPLVAAYMNLSSTMKTFGTSLNNSFGEVEETGIFVTIDDIFDAKKDRYINSYIK